MAGLTNLKLLTDFFNKIGQKATSTPGAPSALLSDQAAQASGNPENQR
jgi:hypothetical protein